MSFVDTISRFPKGLVAFVAIALGIGLIVLSDPPKTKCDAQAELFKEKQQGFIYLREGEKDTPTHYKKLFDFCQEANSPGGCYELFQKLNQFLAEIKNTNLECRSEILKLKAVKESLWQSVELFVRLAWGDEPPMGFYDKLSWLDVADLNLYCQLREVIRDDYSPSAWEKFRERMFKELPKAKSLPQGQAWNKLLLSVDCSKYR